MRVSMIGSFTPDQLSADTPLLMRMLATYDIERLTSVNLYLKAFSNGQVREIYGPDGDPFDHLRFEYSSFGGRALIGIARSNTRVPLKVSYDEFPSARAQWKGGDLGYLRSKWDLSIDEVARLLAATQNRVLILLSSPILELRSEERDRLDLLLRINDALSSLLISPVRAWLRSDTTMSAFGWNSPLEQLVHGGLPAMDLMHRCLCSLRDSDLADAPRDLPRNFDELAFRGGEDESAGEQTSSAQANLGGTSDHRAYREERE